MELNPASRPPAAVVDAGLIIGFCAKEADTYANAVAKLLDYSHEGWQLFAPGVVIGEVLFVLCRKLKDGLLTDEEHEQAVNDFLDLMSNISPPPIGDVSLIKRAIQIRGNYGCSHSNDALYIALAEQLKADGDAQIVTFDDGMRLQAAANAPTVKVDVLEFVK